MGKLYDRLQKQLKSEEHKKDAEDCLKIYEKLKEMNNGKVWDSDWRQLTTIGGWIGDKYPKTLAKSFLLAILFVPLYQKHINNIKTFEL